MAEPAKISEPWTDWLFAIPWPMGVAMAIVGLFRGAVYYGFVGITGGTASSIALGIGTLGFAGSILCVVLLLRRLELRLRRGFCPQCGFDLRASMGERAAHCPECAWTGIPAGLKPTARHGWLKAVAIVNLIFMSACGGPAVFLISVGVI